jgi:hypothetical protein
MNSPPEELLDPIISYIDTHDIHAPLAVPNKTTLHALCRNSKKLYRIARLYLYRSMYMHCRSSGRCLVRILQADLVMPQKQERLLRLGVRALSIQHSSFEDDLETDSNDPSSRNIGQIREKPLLKILALAPNVQVLDLSRLVPSEYETPAWLALLRDTCLDYRRVPEWHVSTGFSSLKTLRLHLGSMPQYQLWPIFRLPNLVEQELDVRQQPLKGDNRTVPPHYKSQILNIETLRIVGMKESAHDYWNQYLRPHGAACTALRHVFVSILALYMVERVMRSLSLHIHGGALTELQFAGIPVADPMFFGFELEGLQEGVDIGNLYVGVGRMIQAVIMGAVDDWAGAEGENVKLVEVRKLSELEKKAYDVKRLSRP